jgi:hypothetical protein
MIIAKNLGSNAYRREYDMKYIKSTNSGGTSTQPTTNSRFDSDTTCCCYPCNLKEEEASLNLM